MEIENINKVEAEIDPRMLKVATLKESQLKKTILSSFTMKIMKDGLKSRENDDFETFDAKDWDIYFKELHLMFLEHEVEIIAKLVSPSKADIVTGYQ